MTLRDSLRLQPDFPPAPVKRGDAEMTGYYEASYTPQYNETYSTDMYYSAQYTPTYNSEAYSSSTYEYKPEPTYYQEPPKYLCQIPPKEAPWYGEYYKWARTSDPRFISVSSLNLHL